MYIFVVSSMHSYESSDEVYFGADGMFLSMEEATAYIEKEINDIVSGKNKEDHELFYGEDDYNSDNVYVSEDLIDDHRHCFRWEVNAIEVPSVIEEAVATDKKNN